MMGRTAKIIGFGVAAFIAAKLVQAWRNVRYRFSDVKFAGIDTTVTLTLNFTVYNPTIVNLAIGELNLDVLLDGAKIGEVRRLDGRQLASRSETTFPLVVSISAPDAVSRAWELLGYSTVQSWTINFNGTLEVEGHSLGINYDYRLNGTTI